MRPHPGCWSRAYSFTTVALFSSPCSVVLSVSMTTIRRSGNDSIQPFSSVHPALETMLPVALSRSPRVKAPRSVFVAGMMMSRLPAAFRGVIGFWHCSDYGRLMPAIGEKPKAKHLWRMGVLKANNPEMLHDLVYLLRNESGGLSDVTARVSSSLVDEDAQRRAWVTAAVRKASDAGHPYIHGGKDAVGGLYARRSELHPLVRSLGRVKLAGLVDELVNAGELVTRQVEWRDTRGRTRAWPTIDVKGGRYDCKQPDRVEAGVQWDAPDWEGAWTFDTATGEVIPIGAPRMQLGG
jgi:hypothetical protein